MDLKLLAIMQKGSSIIVRGNISEVNEQLKMINQKFSTNQINEDMVEITKITKRSKMNISETIERQLKDWSGYKQHIGDDIIFNGIEVTIRCIVSKFNKVNNEIFKVSKMENGSFRIYKDINKIMKKEFITEDEYNLFNLDVIDKNKMMMAKVVRSEMTPSKPVMLENTSLEYAFEDDSEDQESDFHEDATSSDVDDDDDDEMNMQDDEINLMDQTID